MSTKYAYLVMVEAGNNNNKFYEMVDNGNGTFTSFNGRVDVSRVQQKPVSIHDWDKTLRSKIKKGYQDITHLKSVKSTVTPAGATASKYIDIKNHVVKSLIDTLERYSNLSIQQNYTVKAVDVSQAQIDEAENIIKELTSEMKKGNLTETNKLLTKLFVTIPRKMKQVREHLFVTLGQKEFDKLNEEIDLLGTMRQQVQQVMALQPTTTAAPSQLTILDSLGITCEEVTDRKELDLILHKMQDRKSLFHKAYKIVNHRTQKQFNSFKPIKPKQEIFWHGSRNANWLSIMSKGLMIRPSGAVHTGSMFGDGIYYADKFQKSYGYTDGRGSYWAGGGQNEAFMALYNVHVGKQKEILHHDSSCYKLSKSVLDREGYDSVFAKGGADLRNNEYIVYDGAQCTIEYLIWLKC